MLAFEIGYEIGTNKATLICGGRGGVMEAASKGCKTANGLVVGILPESNEIKSEANPYLDIVIPTAMGWTRNSLVVLASDGLIVVGGKAGTLSEIAFAWMYNKPIISLDSEKISPEAWGRQLAGMKIDNRRKDIIFAESDPKKIVKILLEKILESKNGPPQI